VQAGNSATNDTQKLFYEEMGEHSGGVYLDLKKLDLITDMFLAVCYREFGGEHLETYRKEVLAEGRMNAEMTDMFSQLTRANSELTPAALKKATKSEKTTGVWYQRKFDKGNSPRYFFDPATKKFGTSAPKAKASSSTTTTTAKGKGKKRKADEITEKEEKKEEKEEKKEDAKAEEKEEKSAKGKGKGKKKAPASKKKAR